MIKVKFTADIGYAKVGDIETYPEAEAKLLIEKGVAEAYVPEPVSDETEEKATKFKKGITHV